MNYSSLRTLLYQAVRVGDQRTVRAIIRVLEIEYRNLQLLRN